MTFKGGKHRRTNKKSKLSRNKNKTQFKKRGISFMKQNKRNRTIRTKKIIGGDKEFKKQIDKLTAELKKLQDKEKEEWENFGPSIAGNPSRIDKLTAELKTLQDKEKEEWKNLGPNIADNPSRIDELTVKVETLNKSIEDLTEKLKKRKDKISEFQLGI